MTDAEERSAFEAWAETEGYRVDRYVTDDREYIIAGAQCAWEGWKAGRAALSHPPQPGLNPPVQNKEGA
jgi:hypothetical protein